ncbi:hypothetical protein [Rhizobium binae]|uniref:hypothetical protein n=1 Tax=Rhizobium binae TaxID=1138190 RepID=UPI001C83F810|nr:hypothetical protein [Rhizobium binae]MBX4967760.1 hypothetical protein [Rhizobium binae]
MPENHAPPGLKPDGVAIGRLSCNLFQCDLAGDLAIDQFQLPLRLPPLLSYAIVAHGGLPLQPSRNPPLPAQTTRRAVIGNVTVRIDNETEMATRGVFGAGHKKEHFLCPPIAPASACGDDLRHVGMVAGKDRGDHDQSQAHY